MLMGRSQQLPVLQHKSFNQPWGIQVKQLTKICWHMIAHPIQPRLLLEQRRFKPCLVLAYILVQSSHCMLEACMLLAGVRVHELW